MRIAALWVTIAGLASGLGLGWCVRVWSPARGGREAPTAPSAREARGAAAAREARGAAAAREGRGASSARGATEPRGGDIAPEPGRISPAVSPAPRELLVALEGVGEDLAGGGGLEEAVARLRTLESRFATRPEPALFASELLRGAGDVPGALAASARAVAAAPRDPRAHIERGAGLEAAGDHEAAEGAYREAARLDSTSAAAWMGAGRMALARRQTEVAIDAFRGALAAAPDDAGAMHYLAILMRESGDFPEAIRLGRAALEREPGNTSVRLNLAQTYLGAGDPASAAREFERALRAEPRSAQGHYFHGVALERIDRIEDALAAQRRSVTIDRDFHPAWFALAGLHRRRGEVERAAEAEREFERARAMRRRARGGGATE